MMENVFSAIMDLFSAIFTKLSEQEILLRETDRMTESLEAKFSEIFEAIHKICVKLEQWIGV